MNVLEKRVVYALSIFVHFLSKGKPINPSILEKFWKDLQTKNYLKYKDSEGNKFTLTLNSSEIKDQIDYAEFISYIHDSQEYLKQDNFAIALNLLNTGDNNLNIKVANNIIISFKNKDSEILDLTINFSDKTNYSCVIGKRDLYVDGGFKKNYDFIAKLFFHSNQQHPPTSLYRDYMQIQKDSNYYDSVKFLYDYFIEEINKNMDDSSYVEELFNKVFLLSHGTILDSSISHIVDGRDKIHISKKNIVNARYVAETTNTTTPILKVKMDSMDLDLFKIRTKKEKYKDELRYKCYFELGSGFKLLINEE